MPAHQWQLLASGAFQQAMPQSLGLAPGSQIFPLAAQMPIAPAGFQFGANPLWAQAMTAQLAALQQQQAAMLLSAGASQGKAAEESPQKKMKANDEEEEGESESEKPAATEETGKSDSGEEKFYDAVSPS